MSKIMGAIWEFREKGNPLVAGDRGAEATMLNQTSKAREQMLRKCSKSWLTL